MFSKVKRSVIVAGLLMAFALPSFAWDEVGHKLTAYIAWQRMTPATRTKVISLLISAPEDSQLATFYLGAKGDTDRSYGSRSTEAKRREFFMFAATWPDVVRDKAFPVRIKKYHHGDWHYVDTLWTLKDGKVEPVESTEPSGLALTKLIEFNTLIRSNAPDADKAIAIAWLEHLIGDIHQPLHAESEVYEGKPDNGGNRFFLTPKDAAKSDNLHSFWDEIIIRSLPNAADKCDADYLDPIGDEIMRLYPYDKLRSDLADGKFDTWRAESYQLATSEAYTGVTFGKTPSDSYKKKALEIARRRIALAGYRMADEFNDAFGTAPGGPVTPGQ